MFGVYMSSASGDMYSICHMTSRDHPIYVSFNLLVETWSTWKFGDHRNSDSQEEKYFIKYMNLLNTYYHWKTELIG